jgi:glutamate synthase domain-containing protein 3
LRRESNEEDDMTATTAERPATAQPAAPDARPAPRGAVSGERRRVGHTTEAPPVERTGDVATIDCGGVYYRAVNEAVRAAVEDGATTVRLENVNGQRYIGTGLRGEALRIEVRGTPGQAVAMFMDGPTVEIFGNAQDGVGNTMNSGRVIVHGGVGDVLGYGMRRGHLLVRGDAGYRAGIHMKAGEGGGPAVVCGGKARDFFGEYMAGGLLVLLGVDSRVDGPIVGGHLGAGMHGGEIYIRGEVLPWQCGGEVRMAPATEAETEALRPLLAEYCAAFGTDLAALFAEPFTRIAPAGSRPYARLYTYL